MPSARPIFLTIVRRSKQLGSINNPLVERHRAKLTPPSTDETASKSDEFSKNALLFRYTHPDFIPNPVPYFRDYLSEKLERQDMLKRRTQIDIPVFFVGSIMSVECSDQFAPTKRNRFVGICICRSGHGLRHFFVLRNVVGGVGIELRYDMYNPNIQKIEVLKLEKRLDEQLFYLRNCPPEYSTFDFDMVPESSADKKSKLSNLESCVNRLRVPLNPPPWDRKWHRIENLQGLFIDEKHLTLAQVAEAEKYHKPWLKFDVMRHYRRQIPDDDVIPIYGEYRKSTQMSRDTAQSMQQSTRLKRTRQLPSAS